MSPLVSLVVSPVLFLLSPLLRSTPPVPPPRRRRRAQLQPQEEMIVDILPDLSPATAIPRRPYALFTKCYLQQSSFEEPTEPSYKIHEEGTNKGLQKLTDGLDFASAKKPSVRVPIHGAVPPDHLETHARRSLVVSKGKSEKGQLPFWQLPFSFLGSEKNRVGRDPSGPRSRWAEIQVGRDPGGPSSRWAEIQVGRDPGGTRYRWAEIQVGRDSADIRLVAALSEEWYLSAYQRALIKVRTARAPPRAEIRLGRDSDRWAEIRVGRDSVRWAEIRLGRDSVRWAEI
ncbi:hypothetical protein OUZ56_003649 [Daphnia magna]|uniref:Uncharacterized protein n=1 Tax=Daphnia magna TaxID=35525 RepID=A0ABR0A9B2_9CRUS|nr:hypothetical protein OUZ56_003649 [Daphnia magna]